MTLLDEVVTRYHKLLESATHQDANSIGELNAAMAARGLVQTGRPVCPVLRPHFLSRRQYDNVAKGATALYSALERLRQMAAADSTLLGRIELLPAEKMLAGLNPGYSHFAVTSLFDAHVNNGSFQFVRGHSEGPASPAYSDALAEVFAASGPMKELRKRYKLTSIPTVDRLLESVLAAYKATPGHKRFPRIAIVEMRPPFSHHPTPGNELLAEHFRKAGYPTEVVTPEQLEYRGGVLSRGSFGIEIVYRRVSAQEFLLRFDLSHPLVRAYREGHVCLVNGFQAELLQKRAIFGLLTDESVVSSFPLVERKAIREHIPWTRSVAAVKTDYHGEPVDLPQFILDQREKLVLRPNDEGSELHSYRGAEMDGSAWERALRTAMRNPYVVQDADVPVRQQFPVASGNTVESREMEVDVYPNLFLGEVAGCSTMVKAATSGFTTLAGVTATFIAEGK